MKKIKMYVAVPTTGSILDTQVYTLRELEDRYGDKIEFVYPDICVRRIFHDFARNAMVEDFLDTDCDVMWFLDSDIAPSKHCLDLITLHWDKWQAAGCPYPVFMTPAGYDNPQVVFTVFKGRTEQGLAPALIPREGTEFVDGIATGCIFLKKEVFKGLQAPFFEFKYNQKTRMIEEGEDLGFCKKLNDQGIKFFIDYSMVCKHYKKVCLLEVNNYAIEYSNKSVIAYDKQIRSQVETLEKFVKDRVKSKSSLTL